MNPVDVQPYGPARPILLINCPERTTREEADEFKAAGKRALPGCHVLVLGGGASATVHPTTKVEITDRTLAEAKVAAVIENYLGQYKGRGV